MDIHQKFREEILELPEHIKLEGRSELIALAKLLLEMQAKHIVISEQGERVLVVSMEEYGVRMLGTFLENAEMPQRVLLATIDEKSLQEFAEKNNITVTYEESDLRTMLGKLAAQQPQTYHSLLRSGQRLTKILRQQKEK
jgi:hypothetical protein